MFDACVGVLLCFQCHGQRRTTLSVLPHTTFYSVSPPEVGYHSGWSRADSSDTVTKLVLISFVLSYSESDLCAAFQITCWKAWGLKAVQLGAVSWLLSFSYLLFNSLVFLNLYAEKWILSRQIPNPIHNDWAPTKLRLNIIKYVSMRTFSLKPEELNSVVVQWSIY